MKPMFCAALIVVAMPKVGEASTMDNREIKAMISGKQVNLKTRWGSFPLRYARNGRVTGDGTGLGLARFFAPKETGRWWVQNDRMCQRFPTWYDGRTFCFRLTKNGPRTIEWVRSDGASGTATVKP